MQVILRAACIAAALSFGVTATALTADANPNATLIYFDAVSNQTLDPQEPQNNSSFAQGPLMAIYDSLVRLDEAGDPKPGLAESLEIQSRPDRAHADVAPGRHVP